MEKPKPKDFGYDKKYGWPDKVRLQKYRHAMSEYQKYLFNEARGVVENFAHEPTKEAHTEALNKHIVMGRSELLLAFVQYLKEQGHLDNGYQAETIVENFQGKQ